MGSNLILFVTLYKKRRKQTEHTERRPPGNGDTDSSDASTIQEGQGLLAITSSEEKSRKDPLARAWREPDLNLISDFWSPDQR